MDDFSGPSNRQRRFYRQPLVFAQRCDETGRLVSLAAATLFKLGITEPRRHVLLAASGSIATLIVSRSPFSDTNLALLDRVAADKQFKILLSPDRDPTSSMLGRIIISGNAQELQQLTASLPLDLTPPDRRTAVLLQSAAAV